MTTPRLIAFSADDQNAATLAFWRDETNAPACVMLYEQFVTREPKQTMGRILTYDPKLMIRELERLMAARLLRNGDIVIRNVEDGHPLDGPTFAYVHRRYAEDLRAFADRYGFLTGAYGLFKMRHNPEAMHYRGARPFEMSDAAAASVIDADSVAVAELYCTSVSAPKLPFRQTYRIRDTDQRAWMVRQVDDVRRYSSKPVIAFCHPFYVRPGGPMHGKPLNSRDLAISIEAGERADMLALWAHLGHTTGGHRVEDVVQGAVQFQMPRASDVAKQIQRAIETSKG